MIDRSTNVEEEKSMNNQDVGPNPYVFNIEELTLANENFRTAVWTGQQFQMTLMTIPVGGEVGLEVHDDTDQFLRIEQGSAKVVMGPSADDLNQEWEAKDDWAMFIPTGTWHNIINTGDEPLKMYSIYAPPHHPHGTVHTTFADAEAAEAAESIE
jgi:mannose-6-phosphate isomerase-like protein (cupin superfamily)